MVISGTSVRRLVNNIWLGSRGKKGRNNDAPAILNMLPKFAQVFSQSLGTPGCLPQNVHDRRASVARPGDHRHVNELTKVEEQEGYRSCNPLVMLTAP